MDALHYAYQDPPEFLGGENEEKWGVEEWTKCCTSRRPVRDLRSSESTLRMCRSDVDEPNIYAEERINVDRMRL